VSGTGHPGAGLARLPEDRVLVVTRVLHAPRDLVFSVWTKPEHLVRWWGPSDFTLPCCETDFHVAGAYRFCMRSPGGEDHWVWGVYREIVPPERIVFTWDRVDLAGNPRSNSVVTVTFEDLGDKTKLTLHQAVFATTEDRDEHVGGWTECLARLAAYVEAIE
jgi:uncharacterized protein YndB with AHSA1/START domain